MYVLHDKGGASSPTEENKYEIVKRFVNENVNERIFIVGDMNGHIGLLSDRMNDNERLLRDACGDGPGDTE